MSSKSDSTQVFANPTPLGLLGLAVGCAALTPVAFGCPMTPDGLKTAAIFCLLFGGACQFISGMLNLANKNIFGGTVLTLFSFTWVLNYWSFSALAAGGKMDGTIALSADVAFLLMLGALTYGFGLFGKIMFYLLLDVDLIFVVRIAKEIFPAAQYPALHSALLTPASGVLVVALGLLALWVSLAEMLNPVSGRELFAMPGPVFFPRGEKAREKVAGDAETAVESAAASAE
ncbi:MAG: GPR1/FUN34/YaaH family transporter [Elusimicrobiales bacterium]|nr:GPR1/FUN34/YaaH family transporter [Elusimicrobiales bacterium]